MPSSGGYFFVCIYNELWILHVEWSGHRQKFGAPGGSVGRQISGAEAGDSIKMMTRVIEESDEGIDEGRLGSFSDRCFFRVSEIFRFVIVCIGRH